MKRLVLLKVVRNPDEYDVAVDAIQIGDKITLDSGPFSAQEAIVREVNKTHYVLVLASLGCVLKMKEVLFKGPSCF
jgi:transcription antitermination factor NusG